MSRKIKIKKQFNEHGREIAMYISEESLQNAQKFIDELDKLTDKIDQNSKAFPLEPYLPTKNILYRFTIVMKRWKIIFKISSKLLVSDNLIK